MTTHAELNASSSERWMNCPGSIALSRGQPDDVSDYAREGTAAHAVAEKALNLDADPEVWEGETVKGVRVSEEMVEAVRLYVETVRGQRTEDSVLVVEQKFSLEALDPPAPMFGTTDSIVFLRTERCLRVNDLKYGSGILVDPTENSQLMYYALGALLEFEREYGPGLVDTIILTIIQPRASHVDGAVRSFTMEYEDLVAFAVELIERAKGALAPDAPVNPGSWCRFCRAKPVCPTLRDEAMAVARIEFETAAPPDPTTLPPEVLADVLNKADILEGWLRSVRERVQGMLERGEHVPGWKVVPKRATRKWINEENVEQWCASHGLDEDDYLEEPKLRSPAQLEKVAKKRKLGVPEDLYEKRSSGNTLAPLHDPRPALACSAADDFAALPPATSQRTTEENDQ